MNERMACKKNASWTLLDIALHSIKIEERLLTNQISRGRSAVNIVKKRANNLKKEEEKIG